MITPPRTESRKSVWRGCWQAGAQTILLCEHPAVITLGRMFQQANILNEEAITRQGIMVIPIDRGGT